MRLSALFLAGLAAASTADLVERKDGGGDGKCPPVWATVSADLANTFRAGSGGECNDIARAAIRMIFHDCGSWDVSQGFSGGCDGSLANTAEVKRPENGGLADITALCRAKAAQYKTTVADMLVFMGSECAYDSYKGLLRAHFPASFFPSSMVPHFSPWRIVPVCEIGG
jgi:hypothetical protein